MNRGKQILFFKRAAKNATVVNLLVFSFASLAALRETFKNFCKNN